MCPTAEWGVAWDLREMGSTWGRGLREGEGNKEDKQSVLSEGGDNMEKEEEERASQDEERTSANRVSYFPDERLYLYDYVC
jgi:hypothetical protein